MTGQFLGTLDYMSPEQVNGRQIDGKTDQYALGCAAFEMLTGQPPFRREANLAVMWAQVSAQPPSIRTVRPDLSARVDEVIGRALAKSPEDRFDTCVDFAQALREACAAGFGPAGRAGFGSAGPAVTPPVRNPTELVGGAFGAAGAAGAAGAQTGGAQTGGAQTGGGIEPTVSRAVPDSGYPGGVGYASGPAPTGPAPTGPVPPAPSGPGGPAGQEQYWQGQAGGQGYGGPGYGSAPGGPGYGGAPSGPGYGGAPSGPGYGGAPIGPGGAGPRAPGYGPDGTQYGPWVGQQYPGSSGPLITDPVRPPKRGKGPLVLLGLLIVLVLAGSAVLVLHLRNSGNDQAGPPARHTVSKRITGTGTPNSGPSTTPENTPTQTPTHHAALPAGPRGTVKAFFQAINDHDYAKAYNLNTSVHATQDYQQFKAGYADTAHDTVTITAVSGDTVSVNLVADQTDGTTKTFSGSYVVQNGAIAESSIQQTG
jgi:hypothetical protein